MLKDLILFQKAYDFLKDRADLALEKSRIWLRLAFELRYLSLKQYEIGSRMADELGRLLGGWRKRFAPPTPAAEGRQ